ncbi:MAG: hypothetical protein AAFY15_03725 [Cyanobacteria bacterium J06648_11]
MSKALQVLVIISGLGFTTWVAVFDEPSATPTQEIRTSPPEETAQGSEQKRWLVF